MRLWTRSSKPASLQRTTRLLRSVLDLPGRRHVVCRHSSTQKSWGLQYPHLGTVFRDTRTARCFLKGCDVTHGESGWTEEEGLLGRGAGPLTKGHWSTYCPACSRPFIKLMLTNTLLTADLLTVPCLGAPLLALILQLTSQALVLLPALGLSRED